MTEDERDRMQEQTEDVEDIVKERDQLQEQVNELEKAADERDRLQQHIRHLQDAANECDRLREGLATITEERNSLQDRVEELEGHLMTASGHDERTETKEPGPETEMGEESKQPRRPEAPKKLRYCNVCLKSVDKLSANVRFPFVKFKACANLHYRLKKTMQTNARPAYLNFYS